MGDFASTRPDVVSWLQLTSDIMDLVHKDDTSFQHHQKLYRLYQLWNEQGIAIMGREDTVSALANQILHEAFTMLSLGVFNAVFETVGENMLLIVATEDSKTAVLQ
jgi:hypothetical protein